MSSAILEDFITEECDKHTTNMLIEDIKNLRSAASPVVKKYEFNRFDLRIDFSKKEVLIEDILMVYEIGEVLVSLDQFINLLEKHARLP